MTNMANLAKSATDTFKEILIIYFFVLAASATIFSYSEDKPFFDSVYWASATAMTVGYGDISPATIVGRLDAMVLMHVVPLFVVPLIIVRLLTHLVDDKNAFTDEEQKEILAYVREQKEKTK